MLKIVLTEGTRRFSLQNNNKPSVRQMDRQQHELASRLRNFIDYDDDVEMTTMVTKALLARTKLDRDPKATTAVAAAAAKKRTQPLQFPKCFVCLKRHDFGKCQGPGEKFG